MGTPGDPSVWEGRGSRDPLCAARGLTPGTRPGGLSGAVGGEDAGATLVPTSIRLSLPLPGLYPEV